MASLPVVDIISDDEEDLAASSPAAPRGTPSTAAAGASPEPESLDAFTPSPPRPWSQRVSVAAGSSSALPRKRSRATPSTAATGASPDSLDALSPSPPATSAQDFFAAFSPPLPRPRRQRVSVAPIVIDDDDPPTPKPRPSATPILVLDDIPPSPYVSEIPGNVAAGTPGTTPHPAGPSSTAPASSSAGRGPTSSGEGASSCPIPLDSDDELDDSGSSERIAQSISPCENSSLQEEEKHNMEDNAQPIKQTKKKQDRKRLSKEEKDKMNAEKKRQQEERKMQKEANKVQQAEQKLDKQKANRDSGKLALESIIAEIDSGIIENGSIGGPLLTRFSEKKLTYQSERNPVRGSILWKMVHKTDQHPDSVSEVPYILFVFQAEEFCNLISSGTFWDHVLKVRNQYPTFTICYVTNKLMKYVKGSEQSQYNNSSSSNGLKRPQVEQVLCKLVTHYDRVHSKDCTNEAEVVEHIVGLTTSLAKCQFRKPLTWLSVHANGVTIPNGFVDKDLLKKDSWFMSLLAIPKVQPRFAHSIWKKYGTMRSLLNVYMDPSKTDREKERLLQDLTCEDSLGDKSGRVGLACSRRVYRILMAEDGAMEADEVAKS